MDKLPQSRMLISVAFEEFGQETSTSFHNTEGESQHVNFRIGCLKNLCCQNVHLSKCV